MLSDEMKKHKQIIDNEIKLNNYKFKNTDYKGLCLGKQNILKDFLPKVEQLEQQQKELIDKLIEVQKTTIKLDNMVNDCRCHNLFYDLEIDKLLEKILNKT